jgi:hypothetical protein
MAAGHEHQLIENVREPAAFALEDEPRISVVVVEMIAARNPVFLGCGRITGYAEAIARRSKPTKMHL